MALPTLRPIQPEDMRFLFDLYASTREEELAPVPWPAEAKRAFLAQQFNAQHTCYQKDYPSARFDILMLEDTPIGRLYVNRQPEEVLIIDISLLPGYRRKGIGTALLKSIINEACAARCPVAIHVEFFNPALKLYERLGFKRVSDTGVYFFMKYFPEAG